MMRWCLLKMRWVISVLAAVAWGAADPNTEMVLVEEGKSDYVISVGGDPVERHAAEILVRLLKEVTGVTLPVVSPEERGERATIAIGPDAVRAVASVELLEGLGPDGIFIQTEAPHLLLSGESPSSRGNLYAVWTFLQQHTGSYHWSRDVVSSSRQESLIVPAQSIRYIPPFAYREVYAYPAFQPLWALANRMNGANYNLNSRSDYGGGYAYPGYRNGKGFVHTFDSLVPPEVWFSQKPEWFSEINGRRVPPPQRAQWCMTNPELLDYVIERVREKLRESPEESILSISQNDWHEHCTCNDCKRVMEEEGAASGTLIRFVNAVAEAIEDEFPVARIDTLAYQKTRKPPGRTRPRANVIIRLAAIECDYSHPLTHPNNASFIADFEAWRETGATMMVWLYGFNAHHRFQPFPIHTVLPENLRFLKDNGVYGVFVEGGSEPGGEFAEYKTWLTAQLLWNPDEDPVELSTVFMNDYYGEAAPYLSLYLDLAAQAGAESEARLLCVPSRYQDLVFADVEFLTEALYLFQEALEATASSPEHYLRVKEAYLSPLYETLRSWVWLKQDAAGKGIPWEFGETPASMAAEFRGICQEIEVDRVGRETVDVFLSRAAPEALERSRISGLPFENAETVVAYDSNAYRLTQPQLNRIVDDPQARSGKAARIQTGGWELQLEVPQNLWEADTGAEWAVYAHVRLDGEGDESGGPVLRTGIYYPSSKQGTFSKGWSGSELGREDYQLIRIGRVELQSGSYVWFSTVPGKGVNAIFVDRIFLVKESSTF